MSDVHELMDSLPQVGRVEWIGLAAESRSPIRTVNEVFARVDTGLDGDHHSTAKPGGKRQVTLIQSEHLPVVSSLVGRDSIDPQLLRRNIVVSGINLHALRQRTFEIGEALLEGTGDCVPCSLMEQNLGPGGFNAMRGHGGITTKVLRNGRIRIGDTVRLVQDSEHDA